MAFDFLTIIAWISQVWNVLDTPILISYGLSLSVLDLMIGGLITGFIISLFWKGASA